MAAGRHSGNATATLQMENDDVQRVSTWPSSPEEGNDTSKKPRVANISL